MFEYWTSVSRLLLCSNGVLCLAQLMSRGVTWCVLVAYRPDTYLYLSKCVVKILCKRTLVEFLLACASRDV